jgi:hypothetical protein
MMKTLSIASLALLSTAGCVEEAPSPVAAEPPSADLSCLASLPTSAPATLVLEGGLVHATSDLGFPTAIPGAALRAHVGLEVLDRTVSDADGHVDLVLATGGRPAPVHFEIDGDGLPPARLYSNLPLAVAPDVWFGFAPHVGRLDAIAAALDTPRDPSLGVVEIAISDCARLGMPGAIVSLSSRGDDEPWAILQPDLTWAVGDVAGDTAGRAHASVMAAANVRPGPATVAVSYDGETFPVAEIDVVASGWTFVELRPGVAAP